MPNLLAQGGFGCVYYPALNKRLRDKKQFVTKIQRNDIAARNEILIGEKIQSYEKYKLFFLPVVASWNLKINASSMNSFKKCDVITDATNNYKAMDIPYIQSADFITEINLLLPRHRLLVLMETFKTLLLGVNILQSLKVVHFDLKIANILFERDTNLPRIVDFGISIYDCDSLFVRMKKEKVEDALRKLRKHFYIYTVEYRVWCLDIVVLSWIANKEHWDTTSAETILSDILNDDDRLAFMPPSVLEDWQTTSQAQLEKYSVMEMEDLINYLLNQWRTWDAYSIGIIYFEIQDGLKDNQESVFLRRWRSLLALCTSPDPEMRIDTLDAKKQFEDLFLTWDDPMVYIKFLDDFVEHSPLKHRLVSRLLPLT
jgi:serine/threonine protein kinase